MEKQSSKYEHALAFATKAHEGQTRKDGVTPYITHPIGVAKLVKRLGGSEDQQIIGLLHDVIEDCDGYDYPVIEQEFGTYIAQGVDALTNTSKQDHPEMNRAARKAFDNRRLRLIPMDYKEVKLADIHYNVHDLKGLQSGFIPKFLGEKHNQLHALFDLYSEDEMRAGALKMLREALAHIDRKLNE
mgnify:CR=1 FL=1